MGTTHVIENLTGKRLAAAKDRSYDGSGFGTVTYMECPCCGATEWGGSSKEPTDKLVVQVINRDFVDHCQRCQFVIARHPEIFEWVNGVVQKQIFEALNSPKP